MRYACSLLAAKKPCNTMKIVGMFYVEARNISQEVDINLQPEEEEELRLIDVKKLLWNVPIQGWSLSNEQRSNNTYIVSSIIEQDHQRVMVDPMLLIV